MSKVKRGLYWFRNDLRLEDNPALNNLVDSCDEVLFLYVFDSSLLDETEFGFNRISTPRLQFIKECLSDLNQQFQSHSKLQLQTTQQKLIIKNGSPVEIISSLIRENKIESIGYTPHSGVYEKQQITKIKSLFGDQLDYFTDESLTLFDQSQLPFEIEDMPDSFTPFRKEIEKALKPEDSVKNMIDQSDFISQTCPKSIKGIQSDEYPDFQRIQYKNTSMIHLGGEQSAKKQLDYYSFQSQKLSQYKDTRNGLDGWDFSSKLSAYLSQGCISPRYIMKTVLGYEEKFGANESTYWLYFELLWREFYQWHQEKYGAALYLKRGIQDKDPELEFNETLFTQWINGETDNDFVNAFMRQLKQTGWMSNRGRQIVASYFVNQLQLDWRYGAAWFEKQLIDYDSASNWGNWQYLAGVGVDPRGRRAFNLEKQRKTYDPDNVFIKRYCS